jgi:hypothetical protein
MKKFLVLLLLPALSLLQYCSSSKKGATVPPATVKKISFDDNVKPLVGQYCAPCHTNPTRTHFDGYADASAHAGEIIDRITRNPGDKGFMPLKHDKLPDSAIAVFVKWKADGLVEKTAR